MMDAKPTIALIGCGKMGSAMLRGWLAAEIARHIAVIEPEGLPKEFQNNRSVTYTPSPQGVEGWGEGAAGLDIIVLATKPQIMSDICQSLAPSLSKTTLILSIAAGQTITGFESRFGADQPVIRAMPNTPAAIGRGITVAIANANVQPTQRHAATGLLSAIGLVEWINDESLMDAVTALSGSGPAYVFLLIEILAKAGEHIGLAPDLAMRLARQTVIGSAALADSEPGISAATLRQNVTSPGGTTEAALNILMAGRVQDNFNAALAAATARSKELAK